MRFITPRSIAITVSLLTFVCLTASPRAMASPAAQPSSVSSTEAAQDKRESTESGVTELKFHDFFKLPVGPRGLEPTQKLLAMNGQRVQMIGYMARQENPVAGMFILSPLPVSMGDEDDSLADDLPASAVFVHSASQADRVVPYRDGLIKLSGRLELGPQEEADGHVSTVRLTLDPTINLQPHP